MSLHHDNIIWQSRDKSWNAGFFTVAHESYNEDGDIEEWEREFDRNSFCLISTGWATKQEAYNAHVKLWPGPNPGSVDVIPWSRSSAAETKQYDEMVWAFNNPEEAKKKADAAERKRKRARAKEIEKSLEGVNLRDTQFVVQVGPMEYGPVFLVEKGAWLGFYSHPKTFIKVAHKTTGKIDLEVEKVRKYWR